MKKISQNSFCKIIIMCYLSVILLACSSERSPNSENFRNVLNAKFHHKKQKLCFTDELFHFPVVISRKEKSGPAQIAKLDALNAAGLVLRKRMLKKMRNQNRKINMQMAYNYRLTGTGYEASKRILRNKKWVRKFCFANSHVKKIVSFSKPKTAKNQTTTQVVYTLTLTKVSKWAQLQKVLNQFPQVKEQIGLLKQPIERQATLLLGKERWVIVNKK